MKLRRIFAIFKKQVLDTSPKCRGNIQFRYFSTHDTDVHIA